MPMAVQILFYKIKGIYARYRMLMKILHPHFENYD